MQITIEVKNIEEVRQRLTAAVPALLPDFSMKIGWDLVRRLNDQPAGVQYPIEWKSAKQKRFYFAMRYRQEVGRVKAGNIRRKGMGSTSRLKMRNFVPYRRGSDQGSRDIANSWRVERVRDGAVVGTNVPYAPYVMGDWRQPFHKNTGWQTAGERASQLALSGKIGQYFAEELRKQLGGLLK